jgi:CxxC-x17-CxxC domain-containing protein
MREDSRRNGRSFGNYGNRQRDGYGSGNNFQEREMHKAVCSECGKECEVPFKPTEGKPVYCRDCYNKHRPSRY